MPGRLREAVPDARSLEIRPIMPADKERMVEAFERLSPESRYRRFLAPHGRLSDSELRYFTEVNHHDHEALVAIEPSTGVGVGVARYIRSAEDPALAEIAVAVVDDWQRRGVGGRLTAALAERARSEGITSFSAFMLADNDLMRSVLAEIGRLRVLHSELGRVEVIVDLPETGLDRLKRLLGGVARGELIFSPARLGLMRARSATKSRG
jgi:GNAT superfamily N-acetyltransferase